MRKLRKAAVVAIMVGSVGMFGAGTASAYGSDGSEKAYGHHESEKKDHKWEKKEDKSHDESKKEEVVDLPDFVVNNPQFMDCSYTDNTSTGLAQTASAVTGDASNSATLGNVCVQTGPTFTQGDDD